jgi:outer membrane protein assembly factor BamB
VSNILKIILIFSFLTNCSYNKNSKFWTNEKIIKEKQTNIEEIFKKKENLQIELNPNLKISLYSKAINNSFINNFDNNNGRVNFNGDLKNKSKFKFSKIDNFFQYNTEIVFENNNIIFFDNKGSIIKFNNDSELIWKKNYYSKNEKKQKPILFFGSSEETLIIADNIAKYYAMDINTGELLWSNNNTAPFNSQIKIYKDKFFVIDFNNILSAYYIKDGKRAWSNSRRKNLF